MEQINANEMNFDCVNDTIEIECGLDTQEAIHDYQFDVEESIKSSGEQIIRETQNIEEIILGGEPEEITLDAIDSLTCVEDICKPEEVLDPCKEIHKTKEELRSYYDSIPACHEFGVYAKINSDGYIIDLRSDAFTKDLDGFIKIDEGDGDRFVYAETSYFEEELIDEHGNYRYKFPNIQE